MLVGCGETAVTPPTPILETAVAPEPTNEPSPTATAVPTATPIPTATPDPFIQGTNDFPWWNDTVFYEVFVRSFYDSDGNGKGDINGLIEKLDYLNDGDPNTNNDLGVTGIWLMPIMESPSYHGYDVIDYYAIDKEYGTREDFQRLIAEAHKRGIHVIVDLVLNHTGRGHPWFSESRDPTSEKRDWYVWAEESPGYRGPWGQPVWHSTTDGFYYAVFWDGMPDLNYKNPQVTEEMLAVTQFWLEEMGADGFRLDAIKHMIEQDSIQENSRETHDWLEGYYTFYKSVNPNAFTVGEAWTSTQQVLDYTGDEVDIAFQFDLAEDILNSAEVGIGSIFAKTQADIVANYPPNQYATFITNHDQNRVMTQLNGDEGAAKIAASLLLTAPGVPFIYYGEEIGMIGKKPDEDIRLPMQWAGNSPKVGFTTGTPWRQPAGDFPVRSVARQDEDKESLLSHYRTLIALRNENEALRIGDWTLVDSKPGRVYAFLRQSDDETILVLINLSDKPTDNYSLSLAEGSFAGEMEVEMLLGVGTAVTPTINPNGGFDEYVPLSSLPAQSTTIIMLNNKE